MVLWKVPHASGEGYVMMLMLHTVVVMSLYFIIFEDLLSSMFSKLWPGQLVFDGLGHDTLQ